MSHYRNCRLCHATVTALLIMVAPVLAFALLLLVLS